MFEAGLMHGGWDSVFLYIFLTVPGRINPFRRQEVGITQACKPSQAVILVSRALLNDPSPSQFQGVVLTRLARSERCPRPLDSSEESLLSPIGLDVLIDGGNEVIQVQASPERS